ncbi:MAG: FtsQ-type POTRA domain-containing protein [Deltaproteobacteria bacterium]|nr:FtsQ-type POTRA domain-containing protein [Deltaproteobacteria bacterium]
MSTVSKRPGPFKGSSRSDRASVRGVGGGAKNRRRMRGGGGFRFGLPSWRRVAAGAAFLVGGIGLAAGVDAMRTFATTSEDFAVQKVVIEGNVRASEASILRLSGVSVGENIFSIDEAEIVRLVEAHPWIAHAVARTKYPDEVQISVEEHRPVVLVSLGDLYYANETGMIVKRYSPGESELLPVVTGLSREGIESEDARALGDLQQAIALLSAVQQTMANEAPGIGEVHIDPAVGLSLVEANDGATVVMGRPPWKPRVERWVSVRQALAARGMRAEEILLNGERRADRAVVKVAGPGDSRSVSPAVSPVFGAAELDGRPASSQAQAERAVAALD